MVKNFAKILLISCVAIVLAGGTTYLTIRLFVQATPPVDVPQLVGKDVVYALEVLSELGLNLKIEGMAYNDRVAKNYIIDQTPLAGYQIKKGRTIGVILSRGPEHVVVPNLVKLTLQEARLRIREYNLKEKTLTRLLNNGTAKDRVISQTPLAGTTVRQGSGVCMLVSDGNHDQARIMPELIGMTESKALALLKKVGLTPGTIQESYQKGIEKNTVLDQNPLPGYRVMVGTPVALTLNRLSNARSIPSKINSGALFRYRTEVGFLNRRILMELETREMVMDYMDEYVKPGREIWFIVPTNELISINLYENGRLKVSQTYTPWLSNPSMN